MGKQSTLRSPVHPPQYRFGGRATEDGKAEIASRRPAEDSGCFLPRRRSTSLNLSQVKPVFEKYVRANGVADRVRFEAGDFFKDPLPKADVLIMGHILHDWDLQQKRALLAKAHAALPPGGALIVYEAIIDDERGENAFGLLMSLNMLIETPGGFDYTGRDCQGWMRSAGFRETRVEHLVGPDSMVIGIK